MSETTEEKPVTVNFSFKKFFLWVVIIIAAYQIFYSVPSKGMKVYNKFVVANQQVNKTWANVEALYQKRANLIDKLIAIADRYAAHEKSLLVEVTRARAMATNPNIGMTTNQKALDKFVVQQDVFSSFLSRLLIVLERYPNVQANQDYAVAMEELITVENQIVGVLNTYNTTVSEYNILVKSTPECFLASYFNFQEKAFFRRTA